MVVGVLALGLGNVSVFARGDYSAPSISLSIVGGVTLVLLDVVVYLVALQAERNLEAHRARLSHNEELFEKVPEAIASFEAAARELAEQLMNMVDDFRAAAK